MLREKFLVPRHVFKPVQLDIEGDLRLRHIPVQLVLVRQNQLDQTDSVRIVDPPGDLVAQPVKPELLNFINRFLIYERLHALLKVIPEAPSRRQKVMSMFKRAVVEMLNRAPFWVIRQRSDEIGQPLLYWLH